MEDQISFQMQDRQLQDDLPGFDHKKLIAKVFSNWYWFVLSFILALCSAWIYIRYTHPVYAIKSSILLKEESTNAFLSQGGGISGQILKGFGSGREGLYNQQIILKSKPLLKRTFSELDFEVSYYHEEKIAVREVYHEAPFRIVWDKDHPQLIHFNFRLSIASDRQMKLTGEGTEIIGYDYRAGKEVKKWPAIKIDQTVMSGEKVSQEDCYSFTIILDDHYASPGKDNYLFSFLTLNDLVNSYRQRLSITMADRESSIVDLHLRDSNEQKGIDFLNTLAKVYQADNLERKNQFADGTIAFIDQLLQGVSDSLSLAEQELLSFHSKHRIVVDVASQSSQILGKINDLEQQKIQLETQNKYYQYLKEYILRNQDVEELMAPSSIGINDPILSNLISGYNVLVVEKSKMTNVRVAPRLNQIKTQIESIKIAMLENINNIISQGNLALADLKKRAAELDMQVNVLPSTERNYVNIERKYKLNNETYTFLLEKLSEAQIAKASNQPEVQIIETAESQGLISPQESKTYSVGAMTGLAFPGLLILLSVILNKKVGSKEEVENITTYPILSTAFFNEMKKKTLTPVLDSPNAVTTEAYRSLRGKINLMVKKKNSPVIAVTSAAPGEGKSYTAVNIASSYALTQKKTILVDFDLRNSKMNKTFNIDPEKGVVSYILGDHQLDEVIEQVNSPYFYVLPAGPIPPNPGEMFLDSKVVQLLEKLKEKFEVIVIDLAPVLFISDILQIADKLDSIIFIVRDNFTNRNWLKHAVDEIKAYKLKGVGIVINAVKIKKGYGGYGYGYGYGYGHEYGHENNGRKKSRSFSKPVQPETK
ncbi:MAG: polysaccharide biosynthesis tyrosine autokinase [Mangrovibacterium sp.]